MIIGRIMNTRVCLLEHALESPPKNADDIAILIGREGGTRLVEGDVDLSGLRPRVIAYLTTRERAAVVAVV